MSIQYLWLLHSVHRFHIFSIGKIQINSVYFGQSSVLPLSQSFTYFHIHIPLINALFFFISFLFFAVSFRPSSLLETHYPLSPNPTKHKTTYKHNILSASKSIYIFVFFFSFAVSNKTPIYIFILAVFNLYECVFVCTFMYFPSTWQPTTKTIITSNNFLLLFLFGFDFIFFFLLLF